MCIRDSGNTIQIQGDFTEENIQDEIKKHINCLLYTSPSPRDVEESRMPSSA